MFPLPEGVDGQPVNVEMTTGQMKLVSELLRIALEHGPELTEEILEEAESLRDMFAETADNPEEGIHSFCS